MLVRARTAISRAKDRTFVSDRMIHGCTGRNGIARIIVCGASKIPARFPCRPSQSSVGSGLLRLVLQPLSIPGHTIA
jgi:hypothetical protein